MHDHCVRVSSDNPGDLVAERHRLVPPPFGPRTHAARRPNVGVFVQTIVSRARHRAQTVRDQVNRSVQNWKLRAVFEKVVSQRDSPNAINLSQALITNTFRRRRCLRRRATPASKREIARYMLK